jgi:hypothetical protein
MVKVGDKIKVVNANISGGRYKNGDVFTVLSVKEYGIVFVKEHDQCIWDSEYEVVESEDKPMVKVGDKVRYNGIGGSKGVLKKGNVYDVIALSTTMKDWVYVRSDKKSGYNGINASEKIEQPFTYLAKNEYEVVEDKSPTLVGIQFENHRYMGYELSSLKSIREPEDTIEFIPNIRKSDKVKLIDKFYEHEAFKRHKRHIRKQIASLKDTELEIGDIRASTGKIDYSIPVELLEKVEELPKPGDLFKVINKGIGYHHFETGEVVEFIKDETFMGMYLLRGYCKYHGGVYDQFVRISDIEPYTKHRYTDEQIAEAEQIIGKIVADFPNGVSLKFRKEGIKTYTYVDGVNFDRFATCSKSDEYNQTIGRMVALCKQVRRPLPEWL